MAEYLKRRIEAASGRERASLVLKNAHVINVFTNEIIQADVAVEGSYVVGVGRYEGLQEVDLQGKYLSPGFLDGHIHLESSMISPAEFEKAVLPHGTTTVITDPHEITNVAGKQGIDYILDATQNLQMDVYIMIPSCVPASDLDESGAVLRAEDILPYYENPRVLGLAEVMDSFGIVQAQLQIIQKTVDAMENKKVIDGHAPCLGGKELNAYICAGISSDHECSTVDEAIEKLRLGQWVMIREGTAAKNLEALAPLCNEPYYHRCMFVTDDKHPGDLIRYGHIDYIIRKAVRLGADPVRAIKMGSWNTARYFGLKDRGAIAPGYRADFVVLEDLVNFKIEAVYKDGRKAGQMPVSVPNVITRGKKYERVMDSFQMDEISENQLVPSGEGDYERVIQLIPGELLTRELILSRSSQPGYPSGVDVRQDILKAAVFERHRHTGHTGVGFIKGYGLKKGAIASSVAHDSHNLIVVGTNNRDIVAAGNCVRKNKGGLAIAAAGKIIGELPLPVAGLMSDLSAEMVDERLEFLKKLSRELGVPDSIDPFMTLAFVSLPVIPSLRLNTYGLIDVPQQKVVDTFLYKSDMTIW